MSHTQDTHPQFSLDSLPPNPYTTLSLPPYPPPTLPQIKSQYRKLAKTTHPDIIAARIADDDADKEAKVAEVRMRFEALNEAYKILMDDERRKAIDESIRQHIEKQQRLAKMTQERRDMREALERRERKKRRKTEELDSWGRKVRMAKDIVESGGYDALEDVQIEYDREERTKWMQRNRIATSEAKTHVDTSKMVLVKWTLLNEKAPKDIPPHVLRDLLEKKFGQIERVVMQQGVSSSAIVHFSYKASVVAVLQWHPTQMIHPHYIFEFRRVVER